LILQGIIPMVSPSLGEVFEPTMFQPSMQSGRHAPYRMLYG
jgi:hypothetical protein